MFKLYPKCLDKKELSLCYTGHILPCCWINDRINDSEWREFFADELHLDNFKTVNEVFETKIWQDFINMLNNNPKNAPKRCKHMCSMPLDKDLEGDKKKVGFKE